MWDQKCPNLHPEFSVGEQNSCKRRLCSSCLSSCVAVGQEVIPNRYGKILSVLITCPDSLPFQVVIWQAPPCLATHPMFPQLDKAATQHQLSQEWFLVSQLPTLSDGAHVFEWLPALSELSQMTWLLLCWLQSYSFHKKKSGAYNQCS